MNEVPTPHNSAKEGAIAEIVLMPGDPLRARYIAGKYLSDVECFNKVRNMLGYTGTYNGVRVSVMGSGMGMPSIGIYAYELYKFYGVKKIIRIGTCGSHSDELSLLDTVLVDRSYTESNFALSFNDKDEHLASASKKLNGELAFMALRRNLLLARGTVMTSDVFDCYTGHTGMDLRIPDGIKCIANEMESFALFYIAKSLFKEAACLLTVVDKSDGSTSRVITSEQREKSLDDMIVLALDTVTSEFGEE